MRVRVRPTMRGVALVGAALGLGVAAYWTLQTAFLVPAVLAAVLVVAGLVLLALAPRERALVWTPPDVGVEGVDAEVGMRVPPAYADGAWRARTALDPGVGPWERLEGAETSVVVASPHRGVHRIGPVDVRRSDPLGTWIVTRRAREVVELVVGPRITPLTASAVVGHGIDAAASRVGQGDLVDQIVRDYRPGDPVRRIHWRQTARHGSLMVRQEQPPATPRVVVVLDTLHGGWRDDDEFDEGVRAFASLCLAVVGQGLRVEVVETGSAQLDAGRIEGRTALLAACARLEPVATAVPLTLDGPAVVVAGRGSSAIDDLVPHLAPASTLWTVTDDERTVPRLVRHMRWNAGHPHDVRRPA